MALVPLDSEFDDTTFSPPRLTAGPRDEEIGVRDAWRALRRHPFIVVLAMLLALGAGAAYVRLRPPVYELSTLLRITGRPVGVTTVIASPVDEVVATDMAVVGSRALADGVVEDVGLQVDVVKPLRVLRSQLVSGVQWSRAADSATVQLVRRADGRFVVAAPGAAANRTVGPGDTVDIGGLRFELAPTAANYPEFTLRLQRFDQAAADLQTTLRILRPDREGDVIRVMLRGPDPEVAREALNAHAARFMAWRQNVLTAEARNRAKLLRHQLDTLSAQLSVAEDQLRVFQQNTQVVDPAAEASSDVTRLAEMQAERRTVETERSALAHMLAETKSASVGPLKPGESSPFANLVAFPTLLRNPATGQFLAALETTEEERAQLLERRTMSDPDVQILTARIRDTEERLHQIVVTYLEGLTQQEAALDVSIAGFNKQMRDVPQRTITFAQLDRKPKALSDLYALLQTQLKEAEIGEAAVDPTVQLVDSATAPTKPFAPRPLFDTAIALIGGVLLALLLVVGREQMDPMLRTRAAVQAVLDAPVLGLIPHIRVPRRRMSPLPARLHRSEPTFASDAAPLPDSLVATPPYSSPAVRKKRVVAATTRVLDPKGRAAATEAFARLHTNIQVRESGEIVKTVVLTSALTSEGKTTSATNLALSVAQRGQRVLLIDADLRRGAIHAAFGVDRSPGLTSVLQDPASFDDAVRIFEVAGAAVPIHVLTSGPLVANPAALLASDAMRNLLRRADARYDLVVIDSPPILAVGDAAILCGLVDGVVVVVRAGATPCDALTYATEQLRLARAPIVGAILNDVDFRRATAYDSMFRYYGNPGVYATAVGDEFAEPKG